MKSAMICIKLLKMKNSIGKEFLEREIYENAILKMEKIGTKSIMHPHLLEKRKEIKESLLNYYEKTEEFEKCKFITDFFNKLEKEIQISSIFTYLKRD
jgi:hypothetical protein